MQNVVCFEMKPWRVYLEFFKPGTKLDFLSDPVPRPTSVFRLLYRLFEGGDVSQCQEKEHHHLLLVLDGRQLQQQPERGA